MYVATINKYEDHGLSHLKKLDISIIYKPTLKRLLSDALCSSPIYRGEGNHARVSKFRAPDMLYLTY